MFARNRKAERSRSKTVLVLVFSFDEEAKEARILNCEVVLFLFVRCAWTRWFGWCFLMSSFLPRRLPFFNSVAIHSLLRTRLSSWIRSWVWCLVLASNHSSNNLRSSLEAQRQKSMVVGQNPNQTEYSVVGVDRLTVKTKGTGIARFHGHKKEHQYQFIMSTSYMVCSSKRTQIIFWISAFSRLYKLWLKQAGKKRLRVSHGWKSLVGHFSAISMVIVT